MRSIHLTKAALAAGITASLLLGAERQNSSVLAASLPNDDKAIVHVLNRVGFGPRLGDVEKVRSMGIQAYIDEQLHPERLPDASMDARLAGLTTLRMSSREIAQQFELPALQARRDRKQDAGNAAPAQIRQNGLRALAKCERWIMHAAALGQTAGQQHQHH